VSFESFVARRYLATSSKTAHVALISAISVCGLALGVMALVISLALLSGFQDHIRAQMVERTPHLTVSPERGALLPDEAAIERLLRETIGILDVEPVVSGRGWLAPAAGGPATPVRYRNAPAGSLPARTGADPPIRVASSVAFRIGVAPGESVLLTGSRTRMSPIGPVPVSMRLDVAGTPRRGALERAPEVEVSEEIARLLAALPSGAQAIEARLADPSQADRAARELARRLPSGYRVETWRDKNAPLSFALRLEKLVLFLTIALVILVAALNVVSNLALLVVEKRRDLGVFATMGAGPRALARIYFSLGGRIGAAGTAAGLVLGVAASFLADRFGWVPLPADVYLFSHVPFAIHPGEVALVGLFSMATALAASILPARAASRSAEREALELSR
jgi:lipoprotein-releasing system permease protein